MKKGALALLLLLLPLAPATADQLGDAQAELEKLGSRFEVLPLSRGYGLRPLGAADYRLIEAIDGLVYVDGKALAGKRLAERVGEDAAEALEALAGVATEARALELEREIEIRQEQLDQLRNADPADAPPAEDEPAGAEVAEAEAPDRPARRDPSDRPRRRQRDDNVILGGRHTVTKGEVSAPVVLLGGYLVVEEGGKIEGDATVVGGAVQMDGRVDGSLVVVGGANKLGPKASVGEDMITIAAHLRRDRRATVGGEVVQMAVGDWRGFRDFWRKLPRHRGNGAWDPLGSWEPFDTSFLGMVLSLSWTVFLSFFVLLCLTFAPQRVRAIADRGRSQPWRSGLVGLLMQLLIVPLVVVVAVVLLVTIIGIPLLVVVPPLLVVMFLVYNLLGFAGMALSAGRMMESRFGFATRSRFALALVGILLIQGWSLVGEGLAMAPGPIGLSAIVVLMLGFLVEYAAWTVGLGATVLERFGRQSPPAASPEPPPPALPAGDPATTI